MAQTEDTKLRDFVIEALEKNGSLAKIRALLRANIFKAFEDDCENIKQNECLDNVLKGPEGVLGLSIIHEFLDFCNLKNTLFVYKSETRQGKEYTYKGQRSIIDTLKLKISDEKEPILVTLIKFIVSSLNNCKYHNQSCEGGNQSTYLVQNDTSSSTSQSQSDNSSDEKNKIELRLPLDHSDTDTSSDSDRNKYSSEYVPNKDIIISDEDKNKTYTKPTTINTTDNKLSLDSINNYTTEKKEKSITVNSSSESTSYVELKPFNTFDEKLLNTNGLPNSDEICQDLTLQQTTTSSECRSDSMKVSSFSSETFKDRGNVKSPRELLEKVNKSDIMSDYTFDFASPTISAKSTGSREAIETLKDDVQCKSNENKNDNVNSPRTISSVSISDVADLVQSVQTSNESKKQSKSLVKNTNDKSGSTLSADFKTSDDSGDFSDSPIPSLSNLSLEFND